MKIRTRFALTALILAESALLGAMILQQALEKRHLERKQAGHQGESLRRLARVAQDARLAFNEVFLLNYLKVLRQSPEIRYAAALDAEGRIRMHTRILDGESDLLDKPWDGPRYAGPDSGVQTRSLGPQGAEIQDWSTPLLQGARQAGEVHIGYDLALLKAQVRDDLAESRRRLSWVALSITLLALLGAAWLARQMAEPLAALQEGARRLGGGELGHRIPISRADELGDLASAFNRMAGELDRLSKFKEQLMASITHDLRAPLTSIRGHAELLLTGSEGNPEERRESAQLIYDNARRMSAMTDDLTDLAKLQLGRLEIARRPVRFHETLESVRASLQIVADRLKVRLATDAPPGLPAVSADPAHIERVLTNLVQNALKFTAEGGSVSVAVSPETHHLKVTVADTGLGIPPQKIKTLFTRFIPSDGAEEPGRAALGTGLGLSICRELIEAHGGKIWAESEWGRGTRIFFTLPRGESPCSAGC